MLLTIITFLIVLSILVFAHELGHFWTAKKMGLLPKEFGFGFPPRIFGYYKNKDGKWARVMGSKDVQDAVGTIYSVNWVPIGGFVNIGEDEDAGGNPNHFNNKPIWQRAVILSAGVSMNVILAAVLISIGLMVGLPQIIDEVDPRAQVSDRNIQVVEVLPGTPAEVAGLQMADFILSVNSHEFTKPDELQKFADSHAGEELNYKIKRAGQDLEFSITPEIIYESGQNGIGIAIAEIGLVKYPWHLAIAEGIKTTIVLTWLIMVAFYELIKGLFVGQGVSADLAGPVGIAVITGQVARMGFVYILQFTALLSINLAIINFLPIPALDGGRVLFLIIEKFKGSPVKKEIETAIHNIGFSLLMLLVLIVTFRDVARFGDKFKALWERFIG